MKTIFPPAKRMLVAFALAVAGTSSPAIAQVLSGNVILTSQEDVDSFQFTCGCTEITGRLTISGADIANLDSLYSLTKVGELLIKGNPNLGNLNGLSNLTAITAECTTIGCAGPDMGFTVQDNPRLSDISGLSSLERIGPDLVISSNPKLASLSGLNNVISVGGRLLIENNAILENLNGLSSLSSIGFYSVGIDGNPSLRSLEGLRLITTIPGSLYINNNASLPNLNGLESVAELNGAGGAYLTISNNASLVNIDALSSLQGLHSSGPTTGLLVSNNPLLANLNGLRSITEMAGYYSLILEISNNASLHDLNAFSSMATLAGLNLRVTVRDNPALENVNGFSSISLATPRPNIFVNNNTGLVQSCGLYGLVSYATNNPGGYVDVTGNGASCTKEAILANGPCGGRVMDPPGLTFSAVTDTTMTISFEAPPGNPDGYITLLQAFGSPYPDDAPVDGTVYQPGGTIGSSTTVINVGPELSLDVDYLLPGVEYYVDVVPFTIANGSYDYLTDNFMEGIQRTTSSGSSSARIGSEQPSKSPVSNPIGSEVVNPFPNPFLENVTIPFTTGNNAFVEVVIYDLMGKRVADVVSQNFGAGHHETMWGRTDKDGGRVSPGLYVYSIKTSEAKTEMRGMLVAK